MIVAIKLVIVPESTSMITLDEEVAWVAREFDEEYYLATYPDVAASSEVPVVHFCANGWKEGRNPNPTFSTRYYLDSYGDVTKAGINPFFHFIVAGRAEGRSPAPSLPTTCSEFDSEFYLSNYPDVRTSKMDPQAHYIEFGWREGRDPSPWFSTRFYLNSYPDVAAAGVNPFIHFVTTGSKEGRLPKPILAPGSQAPTYRSPIVAEFDADYYLATYPDIAGLGVDPLTHFVTVGWKEGRDPSSNFSTRHYLESYPDVAAAGINPFEHFVLAGREEGRQGRRPVSHKLEALIGLRTLAEVSTSWLREFDPQQVLTATDLVAVLMSSVRRANFRIAISISHDNYRKIPGGVQLCIQREEECFVKDGYEYLNLYPWQPLPQLADSEATPDPYVKLTLNGVALGTALTSTVTAALGKIQHRINRTEVIIHHLLGHSPERITELCEAINRKRCYFWLHDFFSICPSYVLQRNGITYCGAPPVYSNACELCVYGSDRVKHLSRMKEMFSKLAMHVISPSEVTRLLWQACSSLPCEAITVAPHMELTFFRRPQPEPVSRSTRITIAYTGTQSAPKGWKKFEEIVNRFRGKSRFRFMYFGTAAPEIPSLVHVSVHVTIDSPNAMIDALRAENVDLVLHWAGWPETFSFSTFEALAASAFVITNPGSGNVAKVVSETGRGIVLEDEEALDRFLSGAEMIELAERARAARSLESVRISLSSMTHTVIDAGRS